jgi:hypothetical protein
MFPQYVTSSCAQQYLHPLLLLSKFVAVSQIILRVMKLIKQITKSMRKSATKIKGTICARRNAFTHPFYHKFNKRYKSSLNFSFSGTFLSKLHRKPDTAAQQQAVGYSITMD